MIEIDGRGFIKGTNQIYRHKVVVLQRFSSYGKILLPGDGKDGKLEMEGNALVTSLSGKKVRLYDEATDKPKRKRKSKKTKKADQGKAYGDD